MYKFCIKNLDDDKELIEETMKMIEYRTRIGKRNCITFEKKTSQTNFLKIENNVGCNSIIGKLRENRAQTLSLDKKYCLNRTTVAHELVHALGFDHEHNRPDRDDWVKIDFDNVIGNTANNDFRKIDLSGFKDLSTPYDYESIMHYHSYAHAINKSSITVAATKIPFEIKINKNLSDIDVFEIRKLYNCKLGILNIFMFIS